MPLKHSKTDKAFKANVATEVKAGKPVKRKATAKAAKGKK